MKLLIWAYVFFRVVVVNNIECTLPQAAWTIPYWHCQYPNVECEEAANNMYWKAYGDKYMSELNTERTSEMKDEAEYRLICQSFWPVDCQGNSECEQAFARATDLRKELAGW